MSKGCSIFKSFLKACKGYPQDKHPEICIAMLTSHGQTFHKGIVEEFDNNHILLKREADERVMIPISRIDYIVCEDAEFCEGILYL